MRVDPTNIIGFSVVPVSILNFTYADLLNMRGLTNLLMGDPTEHDLATACAAIKGDWDGVRDTIGKMLHLSVTVLHAYSEAEDAEAAAEYAKSLANEAA